MAAFDRALSGIPMMDEALDNLRLGDNVVWQVDSLDEFRAFVDPFVDQAIKDKRNLIYIRFASHAPLVPEREGVKRIKVELSHRFESFSIAIHEIIEREGRDAFYVFDCLSELQEAWATDLMMGNFFKVTCPFLFILDTIAYFPIIRGRHSNEAIAKIRETTQLLLDVYGGGEDTLYVQPIKVWNRYKPTMFLPHRYDVKTGEFGPLLSAVDSAKYLEKRNAALSGGDTDIDSWDRFFTDAKAASRAGGLSEEQIDFMCDFMMTRDPKLRALLREYFTPEDFFRTRERMIGTGMIGGKSCGMLLARKIVSRQMPEYAAHMEPHDSYFIGSDVFYTFLVMNDCWDIFIKQHTEEGFFLYAGEVQEKIREGVFPEDIRDKFRRLLDYFGRSPIIVRSSSIQEDGFGNAFAGKYESVFCVNGGSTEERLLRFEEAVKSVYMSMLDRSALEYRFSRNLHRQDEQMALLVQRVSGSYYGDFFMPTAAGVGYSYSAYRFMEDMDPAAGMLRLVAGLGTRAVDRTQGDYPRLVSLDKPEAFARPEVSERHKYSQRILDVLDTKQNVLRETSMNDVLSVLSPAHKKVLLEHDTEAENILRNRGQRRDVYFISCQGLASNGTFTSMMKKMLAVLGKVYTTPVDIEYTVNVDEKGDFVVNLLQCRPLRVYSASANVELPEVSDEKEVLRIKKTCMGNSCKRGVSAIVLVDPKEYYTYPYQRKPDVARAIERLNTYFRERKEKFVLIVPGRIGTSSPELGVPVTFADISCCEAIFEVAYSAAGYMPELSFGSHMFQDLVESDIFYGAVLEKPNPRCVVYNPEKIKERKNIFTDICKDMNELESIIHVSAYGAGEATFCYDMRKEEAVIF